MRRSLADRVARELAFLQGRTVDECHVAWRDEEANWGSPIPDPPPRVIDQRRLVGPDVIPTALATVKALAARPDLPTGTLRARAAGPGTAVYLVRATGDAVSLVARTDGPAIVLLDEAPGALLEVPHDHPDVAPVLAAVMAVAMPT